MHRPYVAQWLDGQYSCLVRRHGTSFMHANVPPAHASAISASAASCLPEQAHTCPAAPPTICSMTMAVALRPSFLAATWSAGGQGGSTDTNG